MDHPLTVLLVEDDWSVRSAVRDYLTRREMVVCEADCLATALAVAEAARPDVAVLDIVLPERAGEQADFDRHVGVEVARRLREQSPRLGIVFLSAYADRGPEVVQLFMEGNDRIVYLLKGSKPQELLDAIHTVARNLPVLNLMGVRPVRTTAFDLALDTLTGEERAYVITALGRLDTLSEPEKRVFEMVGGCRTHKQAAEKLALAPKTIGSHIDTIYSKLGLREACLGLNPLALLAKIHLLYRLRQAGVESL